MTEWLEIPWRSLPSDTLQNLLEEWCTRDGTDYGEQEVPVQTRVQQLLAGLRAGQIFLVFDQQDEVYSLISREQWRQYQTIPC
jgi:uncharacterized protein YheU (UPF0270 family)